ncbi:MAG: hypothetical protein ABIP55_16760 [Tepidisphaeraceae bacterium]
MQYDGSTPGFSWLVLLTLLLIVCVSVVVFVWQVRRWTTHHGWRALLDWSRERGFKLSRPDKPAAEPFDRLREAKVTTLLESGPTSVMQLIVAPPATSPSAEPARWHVLVRQLSAPWPATGLRPAQAPASLLDHFSLSSYPRMGEVERFVVFGTDSEAARILSKSQARALLPPDVGLLIHGQHLVLDFSTRPFDGIELGRMVALADQLVLHLPVT